MRPFLGRQVGYAASQFLNLDGSVCKVPQQALDRSGLAFHIFDGDTVSGCQQSVKALGR